MLKKVIQQFVFDTKRDYNLITPCCNKKNTTGGFVNYKGIDKHFGFCHYCGNTTQPPAIYLDELGNEFTWNNCTSKFEKRFDQPIIRETTPIMAKKDVQKNKFINETEIWKHYSKTPENNLLKYLRRTYGNKKVDEAKEMYVLGTFTDGGTMFWMINKELNIQKLKVAYYNTNGKRTNHYKVPYKNDDGYYSCLFGAHLLVDSCKASQIAILVESEKTAIVGSIVLPKYTWLAYGGLNGLTEEKAQVLKGFEKVLIVPDFSNNALKAIEKRVTLLREQKIDVKVWDISVGMSDEQRKVLSIYNDDLEDIFRNPENKIYNKIIS